MTSLPDPESETEPAGWWSEVNRLDLAVYEAIAATPTPDDRRSASLGFPGLPSYSRLWLGSSALLTAGSVGKRGRRAAEERHDVTSRSRPPSSISRSSRSATGAGRIEARRPRPGPPPRRDAALDVVALGPRGVRVRLRDRRRRPLSPTAGFPSPRPSPRSWPTRASTPASTTRRTRSPEPSAGWRWRRWPSHALERRRRRNGPGEAF